MLIGPVFYLLAPNGISHLKVAADFERKLGVAVTASDIFNPPLVPWKGMNGSIICTSREELPIKPLSVDFFAC